jgi:hypothetical protein
VLSENSIGEELIQTYYEHSSEIADILLGDLTLAIRSATVLRDIIPGIYSLLGERKGRDISITPLRIARIKKLFQNIGENGSSEMRNTLNILTMWLEEYEGMKISQVWEMLSVRKQ